MGQGLTYGVDIALCIDATGSMQHVIEDVKARALRFPDDLLAAMAEKDKHVTRLRMRVIAYRDILADSEAFIVSEFFNLPDERAAFEQFIRRITADGGGDEPESALEALAIALHSDWLHDADKLRHLVVVWTDASAHPLERAAGHVPAPFSSITPADLNELTDLWEGGQTTKMSPSARRLVLFAPETYPWSDMSATWDEVVHFPSEAGGGLADFEYDEILDTLAQSV
jgi:hypothetical protein